MQFKESPKNVAVNVGSPVLLHCGATGYPPPVITWYKGNKTHQGHQIQVNMTTLEFTRTVSNDSGVYTCVARNIINKIQTKAELQVLEQIKFLVTPPSRVTGYVTQSIPLDCQGWSGVVVPDIIWTREDGKEIDQKQILPNGTLLFGISSLTDATRFICTAKTALASVNTTVNLNVYVRSCSEWRISGEHDSGYYSIDPDGPGGERSFTIYCDMNAKNKVGVTVLSHDSEQRTEVLGFANAGQCSRKIHKIKSRLTGQSLASY